MLIERKTIVMKFNNVLFAGLVSIGLLTIGADRAFAGVTSRPGTLADWDQR